ncbi:hydrogenase 4 subunit F [Pelosinus sp. sgz500959]|uniref:hydrogenase 4 subunit F n=1 Tax=Pelosinus sp. sgz500959 TaxID=3242472 RepID=UPI00366F1130
MGELLLIVLFLPIVTGFVSLFQRTTTGIRWINLIGCLVTSLVLGIVIYQITVAGAFQYKMLYVDQLSGILLMIVAVLTLTSTLFSIPYMEKELVHGHITFKMLCRYYGLFNLFVFTMMSVLLVENLGLLWVAVEATTLASALLVAFYFNHSALEAAWKYVMVCTVGICLALLGTILLYYAQVNVAGGELQALSWLELKKIGAQLDPAIAKLAFIFILIGYGTKAGLAPMHTWLPDAHSQAPSPVSGLLSGALLSCAVYAVMRNLIIVQAVVNREFLYYLLIGFGVFSIVIAIPFILVQHDIKRLLAYSSVEHMGIIILGIGIGVPQAVYGALLHMINHAIAKSALFYMAGTIIQEYQTKHIARIRGLVKAMPLIGALFIMTILAITGTPPFGIFISKLIVIKGAFESGWVVLGVLVLFLLAGIFAGMMYYCLSMSFGAKPKSRAATVSIDKLAYVAMVISVGLVAVTGVYIPTWLNEMLLIATSILVGG